MQLEPWQIKFQEWYRNTEPSFIQKGAGSKAEEEAERKRLKNYGKKEIMKVARGMRRKLGVDIHAKDLEKFMELITTGECGGKSWLTPYDIEGVVHDCFLYLKGMNEAGHPMPEIISRVQAIEEKTNHYYYSKAVVHFLFMYWEKDNETIVKEMHSYF